MFDFLKKKIKDFVGTISRKEEKVAEEEIKKEALPAETPPETAPSIEKPPEEKIEKPSEEARPAEKELEIGGKEAEKEGGAIEIKHPEKGIRIGGKEEEKETIGEEKSETEIEGKAEEKVVGEIKEGGISAIEEKKETELGKEIVTREKVDGFKESEEPEPEIMIEEKEKIPEAIEEPIPTELKKEIPEPQFEGKEERIEEIKEAIEESKKAEEKKELIAEKEKIEQVAEPQIGRKEIKAEYRIKESEGKRIEEIKEAIEESKKAEEKKEAFEKKPEAPFTKIEDEEKEIEELVGETIEEKIRNEAKAAEEKIIQDKSKEEVASKVFKEKREEFLAEGRERELKTKVGIFSQIKGLFGRDVKISEAETNELFDRFELALLESDVSYSTAQALIADLKRRLIGMSVKVGNIQQEVKKEIAFALASVMQASQGNFMERISRAKSSGSLPYIVLFLGPNGMGKTTTIAKVAHKLKKEGFSSVISASDTFRAAAIEQAQLHGDKLGLKVVKHKYGADPAAVAYDAISYAKAHKIDVVLVDTAGRQDTNVNLLAEMQKIVRVVKPNLKVFIAEAIAGTSLVNQVKAFNEKLGVDGIILTKLDCDAKGGGSLSIAYECKLPVFFVGTGQEYDDLLEFKEEWIVKNIMAE